MQDWVIIAPIIATIVALFGCLYKHSTNAHSEVVTKGDCDFRVKTLKEKIDDEAERNKERHEELKSVVRSECAHIKSFIKNGGKS